ncbi:CRTAC1 family protein [Opitutus terrae]|nr:CRTAC1 family protein [Opitutus terrae]
MNRRVFFVLIAAAVIVAFTSGCRPRSAASQPPPAVVEAVNRGVALMGQYDYDGATQAFADALATVPDLADVKVNLAIARFNRGRKESADTEQATRLLESVLQKEPAHLRALYFKGIILQHQGQAAEALPYFEQVLQQRPQDGVAWYILGLCKQRVGQDAEKELLRAIELRPYLASAYYRVWQTLQAAGQTERAAPYLEKFKRLREHPLAETIELPQYNQMGELALVVPVGDTPPAPRARALYRAGHAQEILAHASPASESGATSGDPSAIFGGAAILLRQPEAAEMKGTPPARDDGAATPSSPPNATGASRPQQSTERGAAASKISDSHRQAYVFLAGWPDSRALRLKLPPEGEILESLTPPELTGVDAPLTCAVGDYDNDEVPDLFVVASGGNALFRGSADGAFVRVADALAPPARGGTTRSALWLDADHDGDLDLFVCNQGAPNQLFNNNSDGTFTEIAATAGVAEPEGDSLLVLPGDLDGDRDTDLVLLRASAPPRLLLNELTGKFRAADLGGLAIRGDLGGVVQDFNGDGLLDLLVLGGEPARLQLFTGDGHAHFQPSELFDAKLEALRGFRVADVDLDGDLDIAAFGREGHLLLNDGAGRFALQPRVWTAATGAEIAGVELADLTGDLVPDLLLLERGAASRVLLVPGVLSPASSALAVAPTGVRSRDKRTRSPASGYGATVTVRAGRHEQSLLLTGQAGGFCQSPLPLTFGLSGAPRADYVKLLWSDGVAQVEQPLVAGRTHVVAETQRKISSCPVLFTWNGERFEFITDFAGVGGMGYLAAPGEYSFPQPIDHVKIAPEQLRARNGFFELRITEPMEESAYVDRLELLAIDHPAGWAVFPDERLTVTGPAPTRELLAIERPIFPDRAVGPDGADCTDHLRRADRRYAFEPVLDRRFFGFCERHTLELDFGDRLAAVLPGERVWLFITGYLEYPYSQTTYAAGQASVAWEPIRVEQRQPDGSWRTIVPDAGALGGMSRTMTVDLTGLITSGPGCQLRVTSNLEMFYDQIFLGIPVPRERVHVHALPVAAAELRYVGFPREVSPDGRLPLIYDYQQIEPTAPFHQLRGSYTRYGDVRELLTEFDDQFALMNSGDEIAAKFDATQLPPLPTGMTRSFVLVSHAYCKDMDLYTGTPQTLEPMPFRGMSRYPYPASERSPETDAQRRIREAYQTRVVP